MTKKERRKYWIWFYKHALREGYAFRSDRDKARRKDVGINSTAYIEAASSFADEAIVEIESRFPGPKRDARGRFA